MKVPNRNRIIHLIITIFTLLVLVLSAGCASATAPAGQSKFAIGYQDLWLGCLTFGRDDIRLSVGRLSQTPTLVPFSTLR